MTYRTTMILGLLASLGCSPGAATAPAPAPASPQSSARAPSPGGEPATEPAAVVGADEASRPAREPVFAADSLPDGLTALTDEEAEEAETKCAGLSKALASAVKTDRSGRSRTEVLLATLEAGIQAPGVDVPRCTELIRRDLLIYKARMIESEAINHIKMISMLLSVASEREPASLCPSMGPTPASLSSLERAPVAVPPEAWRQGGWDCLRFAPDSPVYFQYEVRMDTAAGSYEIFARGYPVAGHPSVELFQKGKVVDGRIRPSSEVMRR